MDAIEQEVEALKISEGVKTNMNTTQKTKTTTWTV